MNLQEALAMFPSDGHTLRILPDDALQELQHTRLAGQLVADAFRRLKNEHVAMLADLRELHQAAQHGSGGYAMVPQELVRRPIVRAIEYYRAFS